MRLFASPIFMIVLFGFIAVGTYLIRYLLQIRKMRQRTVEIIQNIEEKYQEIVGKQLTLIFLEDEADQQFQLDIEQELFTILQADLEALFSHINTVEINDEYLNYRSEIFPNLPKIVEQLLSKRKYQPATSLESDDLNQLIDAIRVGMKADIAQRILKWKSGEAYTS